MGIRHQQKAALCNEWLGYLAAPDFGKQEIRIGWDAVIAVPFHNHALDRGYAVTGQHLIQIGHLRSRYPGN